ncbi:hypothetical protein AcW1_002314 [Taiwanofungus camphoratus]|nr:hypothetical protein AcW1_002314 [Antrodia cinnamomea]
MAEELLKAINIGETTSHDVHHDLESFALVLIYVIYRHTIVEQNTSGNDVTDLCAEFHELFGGNSATDILKRRKWMQATNPRHLLQSQSKGMRFLINICWEGLKAQNPINNMSLDDSQEFGKEWRCPYDFAGTQAAKHLTYNTLIGACNAVESWIQLTFS